MSVENFKNIAVFIIESFFFPIYRHRSISVRTRNRFSQTKTSYYMRSSFSFSSFFFNTRIYSGFTLAASMDTLTLTISNWSVMTSSAQTIFRDCLYSVLYVQWLSLSVQLPRMTGYSVLITKQIFAYCLSYERTILIIISRRTNHRVCCKNVPPKPIQRRCETTV